MSYSLGIDTSNYTTSAAIYDSDKNIVISSKKLLPVKSGELGLRQSDAVFEHTKQFYQVFLELPNDLIKNVSCIGVSVKPSESDGSYMPCFLTGKTIADSIAYSLGVPVYYFSHQVGHIMAALYSSGKQELINSKFIAFHISGGTTDMLLVEPDDDTVFKSELIGKSLDLKFGQAIDRLGKLFCLPFPAGKHLDEISLKGENSLSFPVKLIENNCTVSGFENKFNKYFQEGKSKEDISASLFYSIADVLIKMSNLARLRFGHLPIVFLGGVMANTIIRNKIITELNEVYFAEPQFSSDNAAGPAILGYLKSVGEI